MTSVRNILTGADTLTNQRSSTVLHCTVCERGAERQLHPHVPVLGHCQFYYLLSSAPFGFYRIIDYWLIYVSCYRSDFVVDVGAVGQLDKHCCTTHLCHRLATVCCYITGTTNSGLKMNIFSPD